jgi:transposase
VPPEYGPSKTLYNRYKRWAEAGIFEQIFEALAQEHADFQTLMIPSR